jgi:hypothetical protein
MSTSIHASIEYTYKNSVSTVFSFAEINPGVSFSNIFVRLGGQQVKGDKAVVPLRGFPTEGDFFADLGWVADKQLTMLVSRKATEDETHEDGTCITEAKAQYYLGLKHGNSVVLPRRYDSQDGDYYRIQHPHIHDVNWITADELAHAVRVVETVDGGGHLTGYKAALAAMNVLEADDGIDMVRFVYGFDN